MFFGMPARIFNHRGKAVHGTIGFVGALLKIIRMIQPTHVLVLFDGEQKNERKALDSDYKANRIDYSAVPEAENPYCTLPDILAALDFLGIRRAETTVSETDDVIAAYCSQISGDVQIVISSLDSDYFQLLNSSVSVLRYRGKQTAIYTEEELLLRLGILPSQYADFKSLVGDPSDNIKGAEHIGQKTAALLLNEFGSLESLIQNAEKIERPSIQASVLKNAEKLRTNYRLIKLSGEQPLPFPLDTLRYTVSDITATQALKSIGVLP